MTVALADSRRIGASDVHVSRIAFGTMRLDRVGGPSAAARFIGEAHALGLTTIHCSSEYESFPLFRDAWKQAGIPHGQSTIIAKLAAPHFGEERFSAQEFREKVDQYLSELAIERLDVVQWLLRYDLKQEAARVRIFDESAHELAALAAELKAQGKIGALVGFPYTAPVAERVLQTDWCDGLALYVNPLEREMDEYAEQAAAAGKSVVAIRPFAAGRVFTQTDLGVDGALDHVFGFPAVATAVVSVSTPEHLAMLRRHVAPALAG
jgi:aryl-alcohol dehydrogenase-like predicted oxidoreductase